MKLPAILRALRGRYGPPPAAPSRDPFELILWEQVAYLAPDTRRQEAYDALRERVGLAPRAVARAPAAQLTAIARLGGSIAPAIRAQRMRRSAQQVLQRWDGDLRAALALPPAAARRALAAFPMIGKPGADKILAFTGTARLIPLDSNGLRVLQRLGLAPVSDNYGRDYRAAQEAIAAAAPRTARACIAAYYLLREHGQQTCRRSAPRCAECPLRAGCPTGRAARAPGARRAGYGA